MDAKSGLVMMTPEEWAKRRRDADARPVETAGDFIQQTTAFWDEIVKFSYHRFLLNDTKWTPLTPLPDTKWTPLTDPES